jgi:PAS domain S-box-containing protein
LRITDVSDLRQTESQLREAAERYRSLFLANRDGILLVDPQTGAIVDANPAIGSLLGAHPAELLWQQLTSLFAPDRQLQQSLLLRRAREGGNPLIEIELRHGEGPLVSAEVTVSPTQIGNQLLEQYMVRDVSERRRLSEALVQAQKMEAVGQLAAGIAHDMNNVLTVVLAAGAALREEERPTDWMDALSELLEAAGRGRELVARLLSFSRRTPPRRRTFDLRLVVGEVARLLTRTLPASVRVRAEVPGEAVWLDGDESQWHQALLNLGVNGRDAMPAGGVFSLELRPAPGGRARLVARDTGTGMSEEVRRRAFEPFFTTKGQGAGTGLGLPIVFNVVTVHSGTIRIESGAEQGSAFHIEVPLAPPPAQAAAGASAAACLPMGRVLVVDDEPGVRSALTRLLERAGQRVVTAGSVDEGITRLGAEPAPTVVLCDVSMPERSGVELAEFLHRQPRPPPCVIMSGNLDPQVRTRLEGFGVQVFLEKPFSPQELTMALQRVMGGAAAR